MNYQGNLVDYKTSQLLIIHDCETTLDEKLFVNDEPRELNLIDDININQNEEKDSDYDNNYYYSDEISENSSTDETPEDSENNETPSVDYLQDITQMINKKISRNNNIKWAFS